jgi:hypothetical protein
MSLTFISLGIVIFEVDMVRNRVYFNSYLKIVEQAEPQADSEQIIRLTKENSKNHSLWKIVIFSVLYFALLLAYAIMVSVVGVDEKKGLGWMNAFLVFITDIILFMSLELIKYKTANPFKICLLMLVSRF